MIFNKVEAIFNKMVYSRAERMPYVFLFSHTDFEGLNAKKFTIESRRGHTLVGSFYYYDEPKKNRLIVFEHGMFGGHLNYMREIEMLARGGYLVFAYDHTGCMESGGGDTGGFSGSLYDLDEVISALKEVDALKGYEISVVGHSWGGFSTLCIPKYHPDIKKIVAISGFVSPKDIIYQHMSGIASIFRKRIYESELKKCPEYMKANAIEILAKCDTSALIIHSPNDHMVSYKKHFLKMKDALLGNERISFLTVDGVYHNPTYTKAAVELKRDFQKRLKRAQRKNKLSTTKECKDFVNSFDWYKITEQNEAVWREIYEFLEK